MFKSLLHHRNRSKYPQNVRLEVKRSSVSLGTFEKVVRGLLNTCVSNTAVPDMNTSFTCEPTQEQYTTYFNGKTYLQISSNVTKCYEKKILKVQEIDGMEYTIYEMYYRKSDTMYPDYNDQITKVDAIVFDNINCSKVDHDNTTSYSITIDATSLNTESLDAILTQIALPTPAAGSAGASIGSVIAGTVSAAAAAAGSAAAGPAAAGAS